MTAAIIQTCIDPRLHHELLRIQVRQRLERDSASVDDVYVLNDVGGNVGSSFRSTVDLLMRGRTPIVLCGVLHHDDCKAEHPGLRRPLETSRAEVEGLLRDRGVTCPVLSGSVRTEDNRITWSDDATRPAGPTTFQMPRMPSMFGR